MLFNSAQFLVLFFPLVTFLYFILPPRIRWVLLLAASCYFYMVLVPAYILVLAAVISIDYLAALAIEGHNGLKRQVFLGLSLLGNLGVLATFKYFDFLTVNLNHVAALIGWHYPVKTLGLLLPVGLSFHTFQSLSYTIEVYRRRFRAERHFGVFALYVMFFPQLVAGPIERPQHLLPQFRRAFFDPEPSLPVTARDQQIIEGVKLMLIGLFRKVVIADRLAVVVNAVYDNPRLYTGFPLLIATVAFGIQIYSDFCGYSEIARGSAAVMGFDLTENFRQPYGARSVADFWHRWHISLSTWFRDYVYIPLGGNRVSSSRWVMNLTLTFLLSGLWHGANWTFVCWGALHASYIVVGRATAAARSTMLQWLGISAVPSLRAALQVGTTFALTSVAWVFFRAASVSDATYIIRSIVVGTPAMLSRALGHTGEGLMVRLGLGSIPVVKAEWLLVIIAMAGVLVSEQWEAVERTGRTFARPWMRWPAYYALVTSILLLGVYKTVAFIYFQF